MKLRGPIRCARCDPVAAGGVYGTYVDLEGSARTEAELVTKYRDMINQPEVDEAVDDVVNEAIVSETDEDIVTINLDKVSLPTGAKKRITEEFENIKRAIACQCGNQNLSAFVRQHIE